MYLQDTTTFKTLISFIYPSFHLFVFVASLRKYNDFLMMLFACHFQCGHAFGLILTVCKPIFTFIQCCHLHIKTYVEHMFLMCSHFFIFILGVVLQYVGHVPYFFRQ